MARHVMTPARRVALRKAQLASARKRSKGPVPRKTTRTTYSGGLTYKTTSSRGLVMRNRTVHHTKAYKKDKLVGYAQSVSNKKSARIDDLYVHKDYRGKDVSKKILLHQAHATRGKQVRVTGLLSDGGKKTADRVKIRGRTVVQQKRSRQSSEYVTGLMETAYGFQAAGHAREYRKAQKKRAKARKRAKR